MPNSRIQQSQNLNLIRAKSLELALYSSNPGPSDNGVEITSGGGYIRRSISFAAPQTDVDGSYITNDALVSFPTASGDWSAPITHYAVREVGNGCVFYGPIQDLGVNTTRTVRTGDTFRIAPNAIVHKEYD